MGVSLGFPKGPQHPFGTRLCLQSLVCYTLVPADAEKGTDCNAIQCPTSSDMDNTDRAETVQPWLTKQKSHEIFRFTASTVDISNRWNPRTKQSRAVALLAVLRAAALFEPLPSWRQKEKPEHKCVLVFLGAMEGTRTPGLLIRSQSLYPAELPTHTFRSEHDVFYHSVAGLSTDFLKYFRSFSKRTSFRPVCCRFFGLTLPPPAVGRSGRRWAWRQGRPVRSPGGRGRGGFRRAPWRR